MIRSTRAIGRLHITRFSWEPQQEPGWKLWARLGLTLLWVGGLTFWSFFQYLYFLNLSGVNSLIGSSAAIRMVDQLWYLSFIPALSFGMAWYTWSHLSLRSIQLPFHDGRARRLKIQIYFLFCIAICLYLMVYRILSLPFFTGVGAGSASKSLIRLFYGFWEYGDFSEVLQSFVFIVAVGLAVIAMQSWSAVSLLSGKVRFATVFFLILLVVGVLVPFLKLYVYLPAPFPKAVWSVLEWPEDSKALMVGDQRRDTSSDLILRKYLETHDRRGRPTADWTVGRSRSLSPEACEFCLLPRSIFFTTYGIPIDLADYESEAPDPSMVLEVPLSGEEVRLYEATNKDSFEVISIDELSGREIKEGWVALKLDADLRMQAVEQLLKTLVGKRVQRVSLAVVPLEYFLPSDVKTSLRFQALPDIPRFEPEARPSRARVIVKKYIPPSDTSEPPGCSGNDSRELMWKEYDWLIPEPGSLPREVSIAVREGDTYQDLIIHLERAIVGGAQVVYLNLSEDGS